jgi:hypothetical protein
MTFWDEVTAGFHRPVRVQIRGAGPDDAVSAARRMLRREFPGWEPEAKLIEVIPRGEVG